MLQALGPDPMGPSTQGILEVARLLEVEDELEVLQKVTYLIGEIDGKRHKVQTHS